eukprot:scpid106305/ scgid33604/ 
MQRISEEQFGQIHSSEIFDVSSASCEHNTDDYYDSHEEDQDEPEISSVLATFRDNIWIVFDLIVSALSSRSVLNLALADSRMHRALLPVLKKRKAKLWTFLRTPRKYPRTERLWRLTSGRELLEAIIACLFDVGAICFTGCC